VSQECTTVGREEIGCRGRDPGQRVECKDRSGKKDGSRCRLDSMPGSTRSAKLKMKEAGGGHQSGNCSKSKAIMAFRAGAAAALRERAWGARRDGQSRGREGKIASGREEKQCDGAMAGHGLTSLDTARCSQTPRRSERRAASTCLHCNKQ
jgi:hypothetical protein